MRVFKYKSVEANVIFGSGTISHLAGLIREIGGTRVMLISTPQQADRIKTLGLSLGDLVAGLYCEAAMHTPVSVTERAMQAVTTNNIDVVVAMGGGSTIGLAKAIALRSPIPYIAIPTTYAGSEMTPILGQTDRGRKTTLRDHKVLPRAVIYDVDLTIGLPIALSGTSGMNAIAHAAEGLYALDTNPVMQLIAEEGVRALAAALPRIAKESTDQEARSEALYGAWLCGTVLGSVGMALHHKLCHTLGGRFNLPHAETHSIILPHAIAFNAPAIPDAIARLRRSLNATDPAAALFDLARSVGAASGLKDLGMPREGVDQAVDDALENAYWNPRPLTREAIALLLERAWNGDRPQ